MQARYAATTPTWTALLKLTPRPTCQLPSRNSSAAAAAAASFGFPISWFGLGGEQKIQKNIQTLLVFCLIRLCF